MSPKNLFVSLRIQENKQVPIIIICCMFWLSAFAQSTVTGNVKDAYDAVKLATLLTGTFGTITCTKILAVF